MKVSETVVGGRTANTQRKVTKAVSGPVYFGRLGMASKVLTEVDVADMAVVLSVI